MNGGGEMFGFEKKLIFMAATTFVDGEDIRVPLRDVRVESSTELFFLLLLLGSWIVYGVYNFTVFLWDTGFYLILSMVWYGIFSSL